MTVSACGILYFGYGVNTIPTCSSAPAGVLSDTTFSLGGTEYTISTLVSIDQDTSGSQESFYIGVGGTIPEKNDLVLQLDSREFAFSVASYNSINMIYIWSGLSPSFTWSSSDTVSVKLCVNE